MHITSHMRKAFRLTCSTQARVLRKLVAGQDILSRRNYSMEKLHVETSEMIDTPHSLFNYSSGRWLYNEHLRLSERRLVFNIDELRRIVAESVGLASTDIAIFAKIAEGGSNRIFEVTFRNGLKVIARLPYPSTAPRVHGIASEVATMEFLRLHGVPIPRILAWNSSTANVVGSEYIIMERVQGRELAETWYTMTLKERMAITEKMVDVERILFQSQFPVCGSIYLKNFLDADIKSVDIPNNDNFKHGDRFCIGPSTEYLWWYQRRSELSVNRGPWESTEELLTAVGEREIMWLQRFGKNRYPREYLYREFYGRQMVDPQIQIQHLLDYLKIVPYLVPQEQQLNLPTIRHPDLSPSNIFISETGEITGIIDWQHTTVLPLMLQAKIPKHFQNYGDEDSENFKRPTLAEGFATMSETNKEAEIELYRRRQVHYFYVGYTSRLNKAHFHAMGKHSLILRNQLYDVAARPWEGDNTSLQAQLIKTMESWAEITSSKDEPPVHYSPVEVRQCLDRDAKQKNADEQMQQVRDFIGINIEGWVRNEEYESAREKARLIKSEMAEAAETEEERQEFDQHWPFQDHEEMD